MTSRKGSSGWNLVIGGFVTGFLCDGFRNSYGLLYLEFLREFGETKSATSLIGSTQGGLMSFLGPVTSVLIRKFGCRVVTVTGGLITALGMMTGALSGELFHLYISVGIMGGIGFSMMMMPAHVMIIQNVKNRRALAMGIAVCGSGVGSIVFSPLTELLIDRFGWKGALLIDGALMLHCVPCGLSMRPIDPVYTQKIHRDEDLKLNCHPGEAEYDRSNTECTHEYHDEENSTEQSDADISTEPQCVEATSNGCCIQSFATELKTLFNINLLRNISFLLMLVGFFIEGLAYSVPGNFLPDLTVFMGYSRSDAAMLLTVVAIANAAVRVPVGIIGDHRRINRHYILTFVFVLDGICILSMAFCKTYIALMCTSASYGIFLGSYVVLQSLFLADLFGDDIIADAKGFAAFAYGLSSFAGQPIAGALYDLSGHYTWTFVVAGIDYIACAGILVIVACIIKRPK